MTHDASLPGSVSRRRIVRGALWAAPAIVVATAVPAAAGSADLPVFLLYVNSGGYEGSVLALAATLQWQGVPPDWNGTPPINSIRLEVSVPDAAGVQQVQLVAVPGASWTYFGTADDPQQPDNTTYIFTLASQLWWNAESAQFAVRMTVLNIGNWTLRFQGFGQTSLGEVTTNVETWIVQSTTD